MAEDAGFAVPLGSIALTECQMVNQFKGSATEAPCFTRGYGLAFGQSERKTMSMALVDRSAARPRARRGSHRAGPGRGIRDVAFGQCAGDRLRRASQAAALRRLPVRTRPAAQTAQGIRRGQRERRRCRRPRNERAGLQFRLSRRADQADDPPRDPQGDRDPRLSGAVRQPRNADALWLGHRRRAGDGGDPRARGRAEGDRPGLRRHHQRDLDPEILRQDRGRRDHDLDGGRHRDPDPAPDSRSAAACAGRCWSIRCRSPSRCGSSSRARPRRGACMRSANTA